MISFYKNVDKTLARLEEPVTGCWIDLIDPTPAEISRLEALHIPQDYITYALDLDERSRIERENGEILILLRIPYFQGENTDIPYITIPLGIILTGEYIITICKYESEIVQSFAANGLARSLETGKRQRFLLRILLRTADKYLAYLRAINKTVDQLEDQLQKSTRNQEVLALLKYQKSLTYFTTALKSNELLMERLQRSQFFKTFPEDEDLLEDVLTENQQAIEMTNIASNILSSMMDAFASIISNNLNGVMKFLASVTIVLSLPTMIASFFGMNVSLPIEAHQLAFYIILALSLVVSLSVVYLFWKRDWF